jgi:hypothetical protein
LGDVVGSGPLIDLGFCGQSKQGAKETAGILEPFWRATLNDGNFVVSAAIWVSRDFFGAER